MAKRIKTNQELMNRVIKMLPEGITTDAIAFVEVDYYSGEFGGYWVYLTTGYTQPTMGCHTIHEYTLAELADMVGDIEAIEDDFDGFTKEGNTMTETTNTNTTTTEEENGTMDEIRTFTVGTFNALIIPEENEKIFDDDHKGNLNRVEKIGLEAVLADFVSEYEKDVLGESCDSIKSYVRWNDDGVDILDGIIDTYVFYNYAIGSVWMTSNGCILIDAVDLEVYDGIIDDTIDDDYISDFERCDVCEKPYKYDIWSECKRVLIRID